MILTFAVGSFYAFRKDDGEYPRFETRPIDKLEHEQIVSLYDSLLSNGHNSDLEVITFDRTNKPVKKEIYKNPKFIKTANHLYDYTATAMDASIIIYNVSFDEVETIKIEE